MPGVIVRSACAEHGVRRAPNVHAPSAYPKCMPPARARSACFKWVPRVCAHFGTVSSPDPQPCTTEGAEVAEGSRRRRREEGLQVQEVTGRSFVAWSGLACACEKHCAWRKQTTSRALRRAHALGTSGGQLCGSSTEVRAEGRRTTDFPAQISCALIGCARWSETLVERICASQSEVRSRGDLSQNSRSL